jgi:hypothetical protein
MKYRKRLATPGPLSDSGGEQIHPRTFARIRHHKEILLWHARSLDRARTHEAYDETIYEETLEYPSRAFAVAL